MTPTHPPLVSVLLPIFNGEKTLQKTVDSLLNQSFTEFEILAGIDGSEDRSESILKHYNDPRIKILVSNINRGLGGNLNYLISTASPHSRYWAMAEQDDFYYPYRLQKQIEYLESHPEVGLVSGIAEHHNGIKVTRKFPGILERGNAYPSGKSMFLLNYREQIKVVNTCMVIRRQVHELHNLRFSEKYLNVSVDWDYILRFALVSRIDGLPEVLVQMNRSNNRESVTANKKHQFETARRLIDDFYREFPDIITDRDYRHAKLTQTLLELHHLTRFAFFMRWISAFCENFTDLRLYAILKKRIFG